MMDLWLFSGMKLRTKFDTIPAFFVKKSVYEKYGLFRLDCGINAGYELMLRFLGVF